MAKLGDENHQEEKPPPQLPPGQLECDLHEWIDNVCDTIYSQNECKPTIAKMLFKDSSEYHPIATTFKSN